MSKKIIQALIVLVVCLIPVSVFADGKMYFLDQHGAWDLLPEESQRAVIFHEDQIQKMFLGVHVDHENIEEYLWILPIKSEPESVKINMIDEDVKYAIPPLRDIEKYYRENKARIFAYGLSYSIFPISLLIPSIHYLLFPDVYETVELPEVEVHERVSRYGMVLEVLSARETGALSRYVENIGLSFDEKEQSLLDYYTKKNYAFLLLYEESVDEDLFSLTIYTEFPSEYIYYPMKLTSAYDTLNIPVDLFIHGLHRPKGDYDYAISPTYHVTLRDYFDTEEFMQMTGIDKVEAGEKFTRLSINEPAHNYTEDLMIEPGAPFDIHLQYFFEHSPFLFLVSIYLILSWLIGIGVSVPFTHDLAQGKRMYYLGLLNLLTLCAVVVYLFVRKDVSLENRLLWFFSYYGAFLTVFILLILL